MPASRGETVLVVEDEPPVRNLIESALRHQGYAVHETASGAAALQLWDEFREDIGLLLTDIVMPRGINGQELAMRLSLTNPELKVLLLTGSSPDVMNETLLKKNNFSFLPKPIDFEELAKAVRSALAGRPEGTIPQGQNGVAGPVFKPIMTCHEKPEARSSGVPRSCADDFIDRLRWTHGAAQCLTG